MPHSNERTPLIQTVIITPPRQRYSHSFIRRFCTCSLFIVLVVVIVIFLIPSRWLPGNQSEQEWAPVPLPWSTSYPQGSWPESTGMKYEDVQKIILEAPSEDKARQWSKYYTSGPHLAGKNLSMAEWTRDLWKDFGVQASITSYDVYINYPISNRLALLEGKKFDASMDGDGVKIKHECKMAEDVLEEDPTTGFENRIPTFNGYSANGNVTAQYVYVNRGTYEDFEDLVGAGIELKGKIAIAKYGRIFRALKVKRAQELGMIGVVMYSDPQEDGDMTELNGFKPYPHGPARNPSSVQRGSVQYLSVLPGDPTTPGYPSLPGVPRGDPHYASPKIPSVPISYEDAIPILRALNGYGPKASDFNEYWQGGGLYHKGIDYNIGPSPSNLALNLFNQQEYTITPIWNVIGVVNGTIPDEVLVIGNHRDAWILGGAADPNSGSAAINELVRSFGIAIKNGWKPRRTIVFASWDGEEYGLLGSTEWVEEYIPWLSASAVAYINCDVATGGSHFSTRASPTINQAIHEAASLVQSPNQTVPGQTIRDLWDGSIGVMGSGSDFTAFQDFAGISSMDMAFASGPGDPVYHYHSNYDSFAWMNKFNDPSYEHHTAITKLAGLIALSIAENPIIGFNATDFASHLEGYLGSIETLARKKSPSSLAKRGSSSSATMSTSSTSFPALHTSISRLVSASQKFDKYATSLRNELSTPIPWYRLWRKAQLYRAVRVVNHKYKNLERMFLYEEGLDSRPWFKHVVFAPGLWTGYSGATFPGLVEALNEEGGDGIGVKKWAGIIKDCVDKATELLK